MLEIMLIVFVTLFVVSAIMAASYLESVARQRVLDKLKKHHVIMISIQRIKNRQNLELTSKERMKFMETQPINPTLLLFKVKYMTRAGTVFTILADMRISMKIHFFRRRHVNNYRSQGPSLLSACTPRA